jgi:CRP-like cAMP-binding protein
MKFTRLVRLLYNKNVDYFTDTPLAKLLPHAKLRSYPKGQIILYEGDTPSDLYIIKEGIVKAYDIDDQGNEKILHIAKCPSMFPMVFFMGGNDESRSFYTTITDAEIYVIPKEDAEAEMLKDPELTMHMMHWFSREVHEVLVRLSSLEKTTTRDKLIAALKFLGVHHAENRKSGWYRVEFPISHQILADMIGVTRESTTMVMKDLQNEKIIRNPRLTVLEINFKKLIEL